jgi:hypothetical protein
MIKPAAFLIPLAVALVLPAEAQEKKPQKAKAPAMAVNPKDAKNLPSGKEAPREDPELAKYYMEEKSAPLPPVTAPVDTSLPLELKKGDHVVFIGNTLFDRATVSSRTSRRCCKRPRGPRQLVVRTSPGRPTRST